MKISHRLVSPSIAYVIGLATILLVPMRGFSQDELAKGRELLASGNASEAVTIYDAWLSENVRDQRYPQAVLEIAPYLTDLEKRIEYFEHGLTLRPQPELKRRLLISLAELEERIGDLSAAQSLYLEASFAVPGSKDPGNMLKSALVAFELGRFDDAEALARIVHDTGNDPELVSNAALILSRVDYVAGRKESARSRYMTNGTIVADTSPSALYWLFTTARLDGLDVIAAEAKRRLAAEYPDAMETAMIRGEADRLPTASSLLEAVVGQPDGSAAVAAVPSPKPGPGPGPTRATAPAATASSVVATPEPQTKRSMAIQTGSFTMRENAEYAAADLKSEGFEAAITEKVVNGTLYYRVIVPDITDDRVERMILELKEKGFEGFLIYE